MYEKIENLLARTLSSFEYETLDHLSKTYSEEQILDIYKTYGDKPIGYIQKVLNSIPKRKTPDWLKKEIINEPIDEITKNEFDSFNDFILEFREN